MGVQRMHQSRSLQNDANPRVAMAVDAPLVTLGKAKPTLQIQIVVDLAKRAFAHEQAGRESSSSPGPSSGGSGPRFARIDRSTPRTSAAAPHNCSVPGFERRGDFRDVLRRSHGSSLVRRALRRVHGRCSRPSRPSCFSANPLFFRPSFVGSTRGLRSTHRPSASQAGAAVPLIVVENATHRRAIVEHHGAGRSTRGPGGFSGGTGRCRMHRLHDAFRRLGRPAA